CCSCSCWTARSSTARRHPRSLTDRICRTPSARGSGHGVRVGRRASWSWRRSMSLAEFWFVLFVAVIAAYIVLDGFDLGVGMLHPFVAKEDRERRIVLNSIGPIWDGNEVWLVVGGGVLFAAFPVVYASMFPGVYWGLMFVRSALMP